MLDPKLIDKLSQCFSEAVPPGMKGAYKDMEKNFHAVLQSFFSKLDLVTREEFDAQKRVLERTRLKLELLEKLVLEKNLAPKTEAKPQGARKPKSDPKA